MSARLRRSRQLLGCVSLVLILGMAGAGASSAKVFASQNQALAEAFPEATRIERDTRVLGASDVEQIEDLTKEKLEKRILVLHTAYRDDVILGYAQIDVHNVRTKSEAFMVVLDPEGETRSVRILAFHEPLDYLPTNRWYGQFAGKTGADSLRVGRDVHGVVGATLSARAAADGVRRMLAYWKVLLQPSANHESASTTADTAGNAS